MIPIKTRGFTLIELLVVIAIIAILAAILFPVFSAARKKALQATDLSNIKQLDMAFLMYASDNDEAFPHLHSNIIATGVDIDYGNFHDAIMPYVQNNQIFMSPTQVPCTAADLAAGANGPLGPWAQFNAYPGYAINAWVTFNNFTLEQATDVANFIVLAPHCHLHLEEDPPTYPQPIQHICFHTWEWQNWDQVPADFNPDAPYILGAADGSTDPSVLNQVRIYDFNQGANYAYADGHAKWGMFNNLWPNNGAVGSHMTNAFYPYHY
jgi:prepilin-type N-terminal cleavage/methylation domain-containing protein/prepilin-type processing-associated H-X9-DG protein